MDWVVVFPHLAGLLILLRSEVGPAGFVLHVAPRDGSACCPSCHRPSDAVHSHYIRHVADVPLGSRQVTLQLYVRRFRCRTPSCARKTFAEDLPEIVRRYARRSVALQALLEDVGVTLGGRPGARFVGRHTIVASRSTLLRLVRRLPLPAACMPAVLGVDDFALRRNHRYGTLVVDLERHRLLDLWPERSAEPFVRWLTSSGHSGPQQRPDVICRDRGGTYAEAARQGAPEAMQVADRFHLVRNAGEVLQRILARHGTAVRAATVAAEGDGETDAKTGGQTTSQPVYSRRTDPLTDARRERRRARYEQVVALKQGGWSITAIAQKVGLARPTVRKYLNAGTFPEWAPRRTKLRAGSASTTYLQRRWADGCRDALALWTELQAQGFTGSLRMVQRAVAPWRLRRRARGPRTRKQQDRGSSPLQANGSSPAASARGPLPRPRGLSPKQAAWLLLRPLDALNESEQAVRSRLLDASTEIRLAYGLLDAFRRMLKMPESDPLDSWLHSAATSTIPELRGFAASLKRDYDAVAAALTTPWSSGQVEGQVTKVKLIKRQMFGRANFDLLRRRVLLVS